MKRNKKIKLKEVIKQHIVNNSKEYIIVLLLFIIGIFIGVFFVNNIQQVQREEIHAYLNSFIEKFKSIESVNYKDLLKTAIGQNIILAIIIWFLGTTVIGIPVVLGVILYRGFCLGYTISICISMMGISKGLVFIFSTVLLQNIVFVPAILALAVSGFNLYKSIVRDKRKENIKIEIVRHTIFSFLMLIILLMSSCIETFISTNILRIIIKYF